MHNCSFHLLYFSFAKQFIREHSAASLRALSLPRQPNLEPCSGPG